MRLILEGPQEDMEQGAGGEGHYACINRPPDAAFQVYMTKEEWELWEGQEDSQNTNHNKLGHGLIRENPRWPVWIARGAQEEEKLLQTKERLEAFWEEHDIPYRNMKKLQKGVFGHELTIQKMGEK